jgi:hypothetical protein
MIYYLRLKEYKKGSRFIYFSFMEYCDISKRNFDVYDKFWYARKFDSYEEAQSFTRIADRDVLEIISEKEIKNV